MLTKTEQQQRHNNAITQKHKTTKTKSNLKQKQQTRNEDKITQTKSQNKQENQTNKKARQNTANRKQYKTQNKTK